MIESQETPTSILAPSVAAETPQFSKAEYSSSPGNERCGICGSSLSGQYFRDNSQMACGTCAGQAKAGQPTDSHVAFARAALFGIGGALAGLALYSTVEIVTRMTIGYLALAVGWLVAKAMMTGSKGIGGTRYQITAVLLTYLAISMSAIPVGVSYLISHHHDPAAQTQSSAPQQNDDASSDNASTQGASHDSNSGHPIQKLLVYGVASPFM